MALSSEVSKTIFLCSGGTTYDFDFKVFSEDDLEVILYTIATGAETLLTLSTDYSVSLLTETGGRITTVEVYSSDYKLIARRKQALKQELDYTQNDIFSTDILEDQLDKMVMMMQQLQEQVNRAVKFDSSITDIQSVVDLPNVEVTISQVNINGLTEKTAPVDADLLIIEDSEASNAQKKIQKSSLLVINTLTEKTSLHANDLFLIEDSQTGNTKKKAKKSNIIPVPLPAALGGTGSTAEANAASGVVVLDASSKLPAVDGSALTGVSKKQLYLSGSGNWTCPVGVTQVFYTIQAGGGGGGGSADDGTSGGGGGGGGCKIRVPLTVVPGNNYAYVVGAGGVGGTTNSITPTAGGNSSFNSDVVTGGGKGGGGSGYAADGGSGGDRTTAGLDASGVTAGSGRGGGLGGTGQGASGGGGGGGSHFGAGGAGATVLNGAAGTGYGSGGGGAKTAATNTATGGAGAAGFVLIEW